METTIAKEGYSFSKLKQQQQKQMNIFHFSHCAVLQCAACFTPDARVCFHTGHMLQEDTMFLV